MISNVILTLILILTWLFSLTCQAESFDIKKVITFGDSLSDNGNLYALTKMYHNVQPSIQVIPGKPYFEGRFCNGPVWVEYLVNKLNKTHQTEFTDYAYGGSWVEPYNYSKRTFPPYLEVQVDFFLQEEKATTDFSDYLFTIWHGANDLLVERDDVEFATSNTIQMIQTQIERLISHGAKHFVVINMPDLGIIPFNIIIRHNAAEQQNQVSLLYNQKLTLMINQLREQYDVDIVMMDVYKALHTIMNEKTYRGHNFRKFKMPCYKGRAGLVHMNDSIDPSSEGSFFETVCRHPEENVFWDWIHPSTAINEVIAEDVFDKLKAHGLAN